MRRTPEQVSRKTPEIINKTPERTSAEPMQRMPMIEEELLSAATEEVLIIEESEEEVSQGDYNMFTPPNQSNTMKNVIELPVDARSERVSKNDYGDEYESDEAEENDNNIVSNV